DERHPDPRGSAQRPQAADAEARLGPAHAAVSPGRKMMRHKDRAIDVTRAGGANRVAPCELLGRRRGRPAVADIAGGRLTQRVAQLRDAGHEAVAHLADCAEEGAVRDYAAEAVSHFGRIDGFFNNAGIEGQLAPTHEYDVAEFDKIIRVNLRSMFLGLRF